MYYRHKKDPYSHLDSFIKDERFDIEAKIKQLRDQERDKYLKERRKGRKALSSTFNGGINLPSKKEFMNTSAHIPKETSPFSHAKMLNKTALLATTKSEDLKENEPSSVNDKIPSKFVIDYPNFLKPAKYHPYRRLEEHHIADVLELARKRHEDSLLKNKNEDQSYNDMFFRTVEDNKKVPFLQLCYRKYTT